MASGQPKIKGLAFDSRQERERRDSEIRELWASGKHSCSALGRQFGLTRASISLICKNVERPMDRKCRICGGAFTARQIRQTVCSSRECQVASGRQRSKATRSKTPSLFLAERVCVICGAVYKPLTLTQKTHDQECRMEWKRRYRRKHYREEKEQAND